MAAMALVSKVPEAQLVNTQLQRWNSWKPTVENINIYPSELTYPTTGKGKSSTQKCVGMGYVSSQEGMVCIRIYMYIMYLQMCVSYEHLYPIEWYFHEMDPMFSWGMHQPSQVLPHPHLLHRPTLVPQALKRQPVEAKLKEMT